MGPEQRVCLAEFIGVAILASDALRYPCGGAALTEEGQ